MLWYIENQAGTKSNIKQKLELLTSGAKVLVVI